MPAGFQPRPALALALGCAVSVAAFPAFADFGSPETHVYKRVGELEIKADVFRPRDHTGPRPVVVYLHGGSLIGGGRDKIEKLPLAPVFLNAGYVIVSIDYRLAPETKLPGIVSDVEDAFRWVREKGPRLFNADPERVVSWGSSAGGYLSFVAGFRANPRPKVVLVEFGYGDIVGKWQTEPSKHADHYKFPDLTREEAMRLVSGPPVANRSERAATAGPFNGFVRSRGEWPKAVSGWDPVTEIEKFVPYLPVRNVTPAYPATFIMHGRRDSDIPYHVAEEMAAELARHGVPHQLVGIEGAEHGYIDGKPEEIAAGHRAAFEFVQRHLSSPVPGAGQRRK